MTDKNPRVSVIIPCYNQAQYVDEAVNSVLKQTCQDFEIIIINDGSTDSYTNKYLKNYNKPKTRVINTTNQGLAAARNTGILASSGKYILPLDADDKIGAHYLEKAVAVLDSEKEVGIVNCKCKFFGKKYGIIPFPEYKFPDILMTNFFVCSSFFRKSDWEKVGGFKTNMKYGWEDYDFWLSIIELGRKVYTIPDVLFYYRQHNISMLKSIKQEQEVYSYLRLFENHKELYLNNINAVFKSFVELKNKNLRKNKLIRNLICFLILSIVLIIGLIVFIFVS